MKGLEAHITMKDGTRPIFIKPRRVPYALKDEVENVTFLRCFHCFRSLCKS